MYVGRMVGLGQTPSGRNCLLYRVSSRSFPNRRSVKREDRVVVLPKLGFEAESLSNPYVSYTALRVSPMWAVASNGSQTDPIAEKLESGMAASHALALVLLGLDYEHDEYGTPRIAAIVPAIGNLGWLGVVSRAGLHVQQVELIAGAATYIATYGGLEIVDASRKLPVVVETAEEVAEWVVNGAGFKEFENPVTSVGAVALAHGFDYGSYDAPESLV